MAKALTQYRQRPQNLLLNQPRLVGTRHFFGKSLIRLGQKTGLLFNQQGAAIRPDYDEINICVGGIALLHVRPVHAMEDRVVIGERGREQMQRFDFALCCAGDGHFTPAFGLDMRHREK